MLWREDLAAQALKLEKERQESSQELLGMYSSTQLEDVMPGKRKITPNLNHCVILFESISLAQYEHE